MYKLKSHKGTGYYLNISGKNQVSSHRTVNVYEDVTDSLDQEWYLDVEAPSGKIISAISPGYSLNATENSVCDLIETEEESACNAVVFEPGEAGNYRIKLREEDRYLTAGQKESGHGISWQPLSDSEDEAQWWQMEAVTRASSHSYVSGTYAGVPLRIISTAASNIKIMTLNRSSSLKNSSEFGINGGFFNNNKDGDKSILNIAVNDGYTIGSVAAPNDGSCNNWIGSGAISYDGKSLRYHTNVQYASDISGILGSGKSGTWAQGGRLMSLGNSNWKSQEPNKFQEYTFTPTGQTCLVASNIPYMLPRVYLITTNATVSYISFRSAVQAYLGITGESPLNHLYYSGIWLDGGGSTQIRAKDSNNNVVTYGSTRTLNSIVALRNKN